MQLEGYTVDYCDPQPGRRTGAAWNGMGRWEDAQMNLSNCVCYEAVYSSLSSSSSGLQGGRVFFNAVKEGDLVMFACDDEQDRVLWVQAMYRATGQSYKPVPPPQNKTTNCRSGNQKPASPISRFRFSAAISKSGHSRTHRKTCCCQ